MADIEAGVYSFLSTTTGITNLVGTRIYPVRAPERLAGELALPVLVYQKISGPSEHTKDGSAHFAFPRFQFTCWAPKYSDAKAVRTAVQAALEAFTNGASMGGVVVSEIIVMNDNDLHDPVSLDFGAALDATIYHVD
jgi:hypothetical protein